MISIRNLTHVYPGSRKTAARVAVADLSLDVGEGEFAILSGPNGSGKSTLFRILCGLARPSGGSVRIAGLDLAREPAAVRAVLGVVFQSPALDKHLTVAENLAIQADLYGIDAAAFPARRDQALGWTDLGGRLDSRVETLSGGLARQVELAKVLMTEPRVILLDEPTTGLDPAIRRELWAMIRAIRDQGCTVILTTHYVEEAEALCDRVGILTRGRLAGLGCPAELVARFGGPRLEDVVVALGAGAAA